MLHGLLIALGGFAIGASLGVLGGGGTILTLPLLLALGIEAKPAIASSLAVVAATACVAAAPHARAGHVDWRAAALFGPATALGGYLAGQAAGFIPGEILLLVFTALMIAAGLSMLLRRSASSPAPTSRRMPAAALAVQGAAIGALTGLVGAGGGFLFVPAFSLLAGMPMKRAIATSLVVIAASSIAALAGHLSHVALRSDLIFPLTGAAMVGAWLGAGLSGRASEAWLRRAFGCFILAVAIWMLARSPQLRGL
jgi:uncharacterized membrane protein YfcA